MGSRKSSSKKKSLKKKRSRVSSKMRKSKTRRNKSKKLSSSEDYSSSSDSSDYSSSPHSLSSSSSEDDYSRKSHRHSRDVRRVKKRTRRRSSSQDVSEGSPPVKKRKRSNRKSLDHGKKLRKKKQRRHPSISSKSSDSRSCSSCRIDDKISSKDNDSRSYSTCQDGYSSGSEDGDRQIPKIMSRKKMKTKKTSDEPSTEETSGSQLPICSSCNYDPCFCNNTHSRKVFGENNNPKRLRSVVTVPVKTHGIEEDQQRINMSKEEIMNNHHDCPSCGNYGRNIIGSKSKSASCLCFSSNQTMQDDNLIVDDSFHPNNETFVPTKVGDGVDSHSNKVKELSSNNGDESGISDNTGNSGFDTGNSGFEDLETVLRKKALENLQKFRKELQTNLKSCATEKKNDSVVNRLSPSKTEEVVLYKYPEQENREELALEQETEYRSKFLISEQFSQPPKIGISTRMKENNIKESGVIKQSVLQPADRLVSSQSLEKEDHITEPVLVEQPEHVKPSCSTPVQTYERENSLPSTRINLIRKPTALRPGVLSSGASNKLDMGAVNDSISPAIETTSSVRSTSEGHTSDHLPVETKDSSQFEQKTMSVMRGGEMVQVSYKVYIPQRAQALAKRKLKR